MTKKEILNREKDKCVDSIVTLEIDITVLEQSDPEMVIAKKQLTEKFYREITVKQMLEKYRNDKLGNELRLKVIETLLAKEK